MLCSLGMHRSRRENPCCFEQISARPAHLANVLKASGKIGEWIPQDVHSDKICKIDRNQSTTRVAATPVLKTTNDEKVLVSQSLRMNSVGSHEMSQLLLSSL